MINNQSTTYTRYQILSEKELQQISGGDKHTRVIIIRDIFKRGKK